MSRPGTPLDVWAHRFGAGPPLTVGVEEEYMLLDPQTLDLTPRVESLLEAEEHGEFADRVSPELFQSYVEYHTPVCATIADARRELRRGRAHTIAAAAAQGLLLASAGTHPFAYFEAQAVTARDRYRRLVDVLQYAARRELVFGCHVHVAVADADQAIRVMNGLHPHICELVALSANAPFWRGVPTGMATCRHAIFAAFPRSGPTPTFSDYADYAGVIRRLEAAGCIEDYTRTWWDVRPHARFGTVEVRVMDALTSVDETIALAAYVQALVRRLVVLDASGQAPPTPHVAVSHENKWRAARYGLAAEVADPRGGGAIRVTELVERTLGDLEPHAAACGSADELEGIRRMLRRGNGAERQQRVHATAAGDVRAVIRDVVERTRSGLGEMAPGATASLPSPDASPVSRQPA